MKRFLSRRPGRYYNVGCTYRRGCKGAPAFWYMTPFTNRYGSLKTRRKTVCVACAAAILTKYPGTVRKPDGEED